MKNVSSTKAPDKGFEKTVGKRKFANREKTVADVPKGRKAKGADGGEIPVRKKHESSGLMPQNEREFDEGLGSRRHREVEE